MYHTKFLRISRKTDSVTGEKTRKKQAWLSSTHCPEIHIISITKCPSQSYRWLPFLTSGLVFVLISFFAVMTVLAFHQYDLGSIPEFDAICRLSLFFLYFASKSFQFSPLIEKQNLNWIDLISCQVEAKDLWLQFRQFLSFLQTQKLVIDCSYTLNFQPPTNLLLVNRREPKTQWSRGPSFLVMHTRAWKITFLRDNSLGGLYQDSENVTSPFYNHLPNPLQEVWRTKYIPSSIEFNWCEWFGDVKKKLKISCQVLTSSTTLQKLRSFRVFDRTRSAAKCTRMKNTRAKREKRTCKAWKTTDSHCQIC